jgi:hypothetical protein
MAGLGSSAGVHILPINMGSIPGTIVPNAALDGDQKDFLGIPESADYRFVPLQVGDLPIDFSRDFTARAVAGATAGGTIGRYYRFLTLLTPVAGKMLAQLHPPRLLYQFTTAMSRSAWQMQYAMTLSRRNPLSSSR